MESTANLHAPEIFRRWAAISGLGSVLQQKVWIQTSSPIYPNLYIFLAGHPGTGKTRTIRAVASYTHEIEGFPVAPSSFTFAALVDALKRAKQTKLIGAELFEWNSLTINADEIGTFMHKYDKEMGDGLSALYDPVPYGHERRGAEIRIVMKSPQINILCGATPTTLMEVIPEGAWGQGLMSRVIMIYSDERIVGDDFAVITSTKDKGLTKDLQQINDLLWGKFEVHPEFAKAVLDWRHAGEPPLPNHPRLIHYNARRRVNLYKLAMISSIDRSNSMLLTKDDFTRAGKWLLEAEHFMPDIFKAGTANADAAAIEDIYHFVLTRGHKEWGLPDFKIVNFAKDRIPMHSIGRILEIMVQTGKIELVGVDKDTKRSYYKASLPEIDEDGDLV